METTNERPKKRGRPRKNPPLEIVSKNEVAVNNDGLSAQNLLVPAVYAPMFNLVDEGAAVSEEDKRYFLLSSGRTSGKTSILVGLWWVYFSKYPDRDIVILQATATEIKDSIINEIEKFLRNSGFDVSDSPSSEWCIPKAHNSIRKKGQVGETRFYPITDSKGGQRTRGINTKNKLSLVLFEEAQKNNDENVLNQSVITFIRQLDKVAKLVIVGNSETVGHWFVDFVAKKRADPDWHYIYASCYDIWDLLNEQTRKYIENVKATNPTEFRRIFLGDITANTSDVVFPQFRREKHYKLAKDLVPKYIRIIFVGIDHATSNDTFGIVPVAVLGDGTAQTLEICYEDPKETNRTLSESEQCEILEEFLEFLDGKYGLQYNHLQIVLSCDGQARHFVEQIKHTKRVSTNKRLWENILIKGFTMKKKDTNLGIIKNAFAFGVLTILNEGDKDWKGTQNKHRLVKEIESQRYKNGKLNPRIGNDLCDSLEYGLIPYYSNCYNLSYPIRKTEESHYEEIRKMAKFTK